MIKIIRGRNRVQRKAETHTHTKTGGERMDRGPPGVCGAGVSDQVAETFVEKPKPHRGEARWLDSKALGGDRTQEAP